MLKSLDKYGGFNSYDLLKSIAIVTMIIDHIGFFFYPDIPMFRIIGRAAFPLFAFCIGYNQKYSFDYMLLMLAICMAIAPCTLYSEGFLVGNALQSSILFSIITTRAVMQFIAFKINEKNMFYWLIIFISLVPITSLLLPYGMWGIVMAICGYLRSSHKADKQYPVFLAVSLSLYTLVELLGEGYSWYHLAGLVVVFIAVYHLLINFSVFSIKLSNKLSRPLLLLSRYSLIVYFVHYEIFYLISYMIKTKQ